MREVTFGGWTIKVDIEETREWYECYAGFWATEPYAQINRNYREFCKTMTEEERAFFSYLGIDPLVCDVISPVPPKEGYLPIGGFYPFVGRIAAKPEGIAWSMELSAGLGYADGRPDPGARIGRYKVYFADGIASMLPWGLPEGFIGVRLWVEDMPWLLEEEYELPTISPGAWWNGNRECIINETAEDLRNMGITVGIMGGGETGAFVRRWLDEFAPAERRDEVNEMCYGNRMLFSTHLWHLFCSEFVPVTQCQCAMDGYNKAEHDECILYDEHTKAGYALSGARGLTADIINKYSDVVVTATDFAWAYTHTHEDDCGPYFCKRPSR